MQTRSGPRRALAFSLALCLAVPTLPLPTASAALGGEVGAVPLFTNITQSAGVGAPETSLTAVDLTRETNNQFINGGKGAAWFDYNNDGWEDLLVGGVHARKLYRNNGDETFTEVIGQSGLAGTSYTMGVITPDLTNDGYPDVVFANWFNRSEIFLNRGDGTFENVSRAWNFFINGPTTGVAFGDLDGDGWGDLYIGSYYKRQSYLYKNLEGKGLQDVGDLAGIRGLTDQTFQPIIFDYDLDGDLDIYEANDFGPDDLYRNEGNWTFTDVSEAAGLETAGDGMGAAIGDVDNDGYMDIFVTNFAADYWLVFDPETLSYRDRHFEMNITDLEVGWGVQTMDFNNDGFLDVFVADGVVLGGQPPESDKLFINRGDSVFYQAEADAGVDDWGTNKGSAAADFNKDGTMDLWVANVVANSSLYRNEPSSNHWFEVALHGVASLRQGVGARITVEAGGRTQARQVHLGSSYLSQDSLIQHVGLGGATMVDKLTVTWPSGARQDYANLSADQRWVVTEYEGNAPVSRPADILGDAGVEVTFDGRASTDDTRIVHWNWSFTAPYPNLTVTGQTAKVTFYEGLNFSGTLTVTDAFGNSHSAPFSIVIRPATHPLVSGGPDIDLAQNATHFFSAELKGPLQDYANTTFAWRLEGPGGPWNFTGRNISHTFVLPGVYSLVVNATDQFGLSGEDVVSIDVGDSDPPILHFVPPLSVPEDAPFTLDASATTDNDPSFPGTGLFYWRMTGPSGQFAIATGAVANFTLADPGDTAFDLEVTDASGNLASRSFTITALDGTPPTADGGANRVVSAGTAVRLDASNSSDNDPTLLDRGTFEWTFAGPDGPSRAYGPVTEFTPLAPGVTVVTLNVHDPTGNHGAPDSFTITAIDTRPPLLAPLSDLDVTYGLPALFRAPNATDNDPAFEASAVYQWQFRDGAVARSLTGPAVNYTFANVGTFRVDLSVRDAAGNYARGNFVVHVVDRVAPVILASVVSLSMVGEAVEFNASACSDDLRVVSYTWSFEPPTEVATLNGAYVRWTFAHAGNYTVTLTVADAAGNVANSTYRVEVRELPPPPPIDEPPDGTPNSSGPPVAPADGTLSALGAALAVSSVLGAVMLFRRWRREQA